MNLNLLLSIGLVALTITACKKENEAPATTPAAGAAKIPFSGTYTWAFTIPGMGDQLSTHTFWPDSIHYSMAGSAYTTDYAQLHVSYDAAEQRSITVGRGGSIPKDGVYFVMFFKDITDSTLMIYKHECGEGASGLTEARTFGVPPANTSADHGWNLYRRD
ncbi:MAG: hypothetical protein QM724_01090 [Flavobacteriales bacterium]